MHFRVGVWRTSPQDRKEGCGLSSSGRVHYLCNDLQYKEPYVAIIIIIIVLKMLSYS